jgi:hypothetical protein
LWIALQEAQAILASLRFEIVQSCLNAIEAQSFFALEPWAKNLKVCE